MTRKLLGTTALAGALLAGPAHAADVFPPVEPVPPPMAAPAPFNWTGLYIGLHVGGGWGTKEWSDPFFAKKGFTETIPGLTLLNYNVNGFLGGGQIGYNFHWDWIVLGIEAQGSFANLKGSDLFFVGKGTARTKVNSLGSIAGRIGGAFDRTLVYAKGGAAWVNEEHTIDFFLGKGSVTSSSKTQWGWMFGAGVEHAFTDSLSAKVEYNYMDFGKNSYTLHGLVDDDPFTIGANIKQNIHLVKFGVNYRFLGPLF